MQYYASLCAIAKDEVTIRDWLYYHFSIGFEHATIYDNESKEPLTDVLKDFIEAGLVDVELFDKTFRPQLQAYKKFIEQRSGNTKWVAVIDVDEYIVPKSSSDIRDYLSEYEDYAGLAIPWVVFGSNNNETRPSEPTPLAFPNYLYKGTVVKSIIQPEHAIPYVVNPHFFYFKSGKYCVNEDRFPVYGSRTYHSSQSIQINHYQFMSREDYLVKVRRGCADQNKKDRRKKINRMDDFEKQWNIAGTPDKAIEAHLERFLAFRKLGAKELAPIVLEKCSYALEKYIEDIHVLIQLKHFRHALTLFQKAIRYYPLSPNLYQSGVMLYVLNGQPEKAEAFIRDAIVRSMEQSADISDNYIRIGILFEVLEQYFMQTNQPEKARELHAWWEGDEQRYLKGEMSVIGQFEWLKDIRSRSL